MFVKTAQEKKSLFIHCATFVLYVRGQRKLSRAGERRNSKELLLCQLGAEEKREKEQVAKNVLGSLQRCIARLPLPLPLQQLDLFKCIIIWGRC
jgi:hypothetical protein